MARREGISAIMDVNESVKQLENELRILTTRKGSLLTSVSELENKVSSLEKTITELSEKIAKQEKESKDECDRLINIAKDKMEKSNIREAVSVEKQTELNDSLKDAANLIKSNEGLKRNLDLQTEESKLKLKKINEFVESLKVNLKDI